VKVDLKIKRNTKRQGMTTQRKTEVRTFSIKEIAIQGHEQVPLDFDVHLHARMAMTAKNKKGFDNH
jgi:hypothetical protein